MLEVLWSLDGGAVGVAVLRASRVAVLCPEIDDRQMGPQKDHRLLVEALKGRAECGDVKDPCEL